MEKNHDIDDNLDHSHTISSSNIHMSEEISQHLKDEGYTYKTHYHPDTNEPERIYSKSGKPSFTINKTGAYLKEQNPSAETIRAALIEMGSTKMTAHGDAEFQAKVFMEAEKLGKECEISLEAMEIVKSKQQPKAIEPRENVNYKVVKNGIENGNEFVLLKKANEKISGHYKLNKNECSNTADFEKIKNSQEAISLKKDNNKWSINPPIQEQQRRHSLAETNVQSPTDNKPKRRNSI